MPEGWARLFTSDPQVIAATVAYITHVAPFYCLFGLGMTLPLREPGRGPHDGAVLSPASRAWSSPTVGGWFAVERLGLGLDGVFVAIAAGIVLFGCRDRRAAAGETLGAQTC